MKYTWLILVLFITACDSGGGTPTEKIITSTDIKGTAAIGVVSDGTVTAYDFSRCEKGEVLGTYSLQASNVYELSIDTESTENPILLELSNFIYTEESSQNEVVAVRNSLYSSFVLQPGVGQLASISFWTNLAHARTTFLCNEPSDLDVPEDVPEEAAQRIENT